MLDHLKHLATRSVVALLFAIFSSGAHANQGFAQVGTLPGELVDSDGDGVVDIDDNCPNTPGITYAQARALRIPVDRCGCPLDPCEQDGDGDGVSDCLDQCPNTLRGLRVNAAGCAQVSSAPDRVELDVKFEFAKANLQRSFHPDLDALAELMQRYPRLRVVLEGHTDARGSLRYNIGLSLARAHVVRRQMMARGIAPERLIATGYGEAYPVASNASDAGRAQNRRTVAVLHY